MKRNILHKYKYGTIETTKTPEAHPYSFLCVCGRVKSSSEQITQPSKQEILTEESDPKKYSACLTVRENGNTDNK